MGPNKTSPFCSCHLCKCVIANCRNYNEDTDEDDDDEGSNEEESEEDEDEEEENEYKVLGHSCEYSDRNGLASCFIPVSKSKDCVWIPVIVVIFH